MPLQNNLIFETARWQLFLDLYKDFASIPPYGKINAINKSTGELNWEIPFGQKITSNGNIVGGDINFGGILTTSGNIFFATGTPDKFIKVMKNNNYVLIEYPQNYWLLFDNLGLYHPLMHKINIQFSFLFIWVILKFLKTFYQN